MNKKDQKILDQIIEELREVAVLATAMKMELEQAKAALTYWRYECTGQEPSISVFERMVDEVLENKS